MNRHGIITKEKMESYCKGEEYEKDSVNDDLESLFENIRLGKDLDEEVQTYFLPKLTEEEIELVERRDTRGILNSFKHFQTPEMNLPRTSYLINNFFWPNPDEKKAEMMLSKSSTKYIDGSTSRRTFVIENSSKISYDNSSENLSKKQSAKRRRTS